MGKSNGDVDVYMAGKTRTQGGTYALKKKRTTYRHQAANYSAIHGKQPPLRLITPRAQSKYILLVRRTSRAYLLFVTEGWAPINRLEMHLSLRSPEGPGMPPEAPRMPTTEASRGRKKTPEAPKSIDPRTSDLHRDPGLQTSNLEPTPRAFTPILEPRSSILKPR